ncbi:hypothetical protein EJB05_43681, partial [Eragrostis curvula]
MPEQEPPFRWSEKLLEVHTHLKGRYDAITSVGIPLALAASGLFLIAFVFDTFGVFDAQGRGVYNLSHGIGKKE